jgi:hypothetical protein
MRYETLELNIDSSCAVTLAVAGPVPWTMPDKERITASRVSGATNGTLNGTAFLGTITPEYWRFCLECRLYERVRFRPRMAQMILVMLRTIKVE